ncbi:MAG TPA: MG2 domain-containing protein, partial [Puia sp.]|nr:MG2 domain-containing protein [Puia sp.]
MKRGLLLLLLCLTGFLVHAQENAYDRRWHIVDSLIDKKALTASALTEVNTIYSLARREKNQGQLIKALIYRIRLEQKRTDEGLPAAIKQLNNQVDSSTGAVKAILENMLAGLYATYLLENSWKLSSRTQVMQKNEADVSTWSISELNRKIAELYRQSLEPEQLLTHIDLATYEPIVLKGQSPWLRPTLWDLLAHRALDQFKTGPGYEPLSKHPFSFNDPHLFDEAAVFSQYRFTTTDSLDRRYMAIRLFQRLIRLHLADARPDALIAVDIERLNFVHDNYRDHDNVYMQALARITERYPASPATAEAWYYQANQHYLDAVHREDPVDSNGCVKARAICEKVISMPDSNVGKALCIQLLQTILRREITLQMQKVQIPSRPFPVLVSWQNFNRLFLRIVRLDDNAAAELLRKAIYDSVNLSRLLSAPAYRAYTQTLPDVQDLRFHKTEIAIGSLPPGAYALLTSSDSSWTRKQGLLGLQYFIVSSIAYINMGNDYFVVNRETGKPIAGAKAQFLQVVYSSRGRQANKVVGTYITDADGHFVENIKTAGGNGFDADLDLSIPGDHLWPLQGEYIPVSTADTAAVADRNKYEEEHAHCYFFADRSIYRPGQTMYFKGIATTEDFDTHGPKPFPGHATTVTLYDVNGQAIDSVKLTTNEFGSFNGSFKLPENRLNGQFRVSNSMDGELTFSVEEYKRPKFYVDYDKQAGSYRAGDSIRVTGMAKGYAGNSIDGARVSYHVVRKTRYPYPWMFGRIRPPYQADQEIASGTLTTDAAGKFSFVFF